MHLPAALTLLIVGLPLIDKVATTVRRIEKGEPAFAPDRTHIHHILQHAGFQPQEVLLIIAMVSIGVNTVGLLLYAMHAPAYVMFSVFWLITLLYIYNIDHAWKLSKWLHNKVAQLPGE